MFLIEFNLGFQEVTENLQPIGIAEMKEKVINLSKFWQERSGCFQSSFFLCSKLLGAKKHLISNIVLFYRDALRERKKISNVCCDFSNLMSQSLQ